VAFTGRDVIGRLAIFAATTWSAATLVSDTIEILS